MIKTHNSQGGVLNDVDMEAFLRGYPVNDFLSREEEQRIAGLDKDHADRWKLVTHNMQFLVRFAVRFARKNLHIRDGHAFLTALQDAMISASKSFKLSPAKFITYASRSMNWAAIDEAQSQAAPVKLPQWSKRTKHVLREDGKYYWNPGPEGPEEMLETFMTKSQEEAPRSYLSPEDQLMAKELRAELKKRLKRVKTRLGPDERVQWIITNFFSDPSVTLSGLGRELGGLTRERTRQLRQRGLKQMKGPRLSEYLR